MFKLLIECSKDISNLNINFTDGTSSIIEKPLNRDKLPKQDTSKVSEDSEVSSLKPKRQKLTELSDFLDISDDSSEQVIQSGIVQKPEVTLSDREAKVAKELQDFEL